MTAQSSCTPAPCVTLSSNRAITTSVSVAECFHKRHDNVIRDIRTLVIDLPVDFTLLNFEECFRVNELANGKREPYYELTRDGFTLLAMGFTGKRALAFKLAYIEAFNKMEAALRAKSIPSATITPAQQRALHDVVANQVRLCGNAKAHPYFWGRLKDRFQVARYDQIPAARFEEARAFLESLSFSGRTRQPVVLTEAEARNIYWLLKLIPFLKEKIEPVEKGLRAIESKFVARLFDAWHEPMNYASALQNLRERCKPILSNSH